MVKPLQIFRSGKHTAMSGRTINFTDDDVADLAASYDPGVYEAPLVRGHPRDNQPAAGWVHSLQLADGGVVEAIPSRVEVELADDVREQRFKHISASIYMPDSPNNPKPGHHYLRHVGFLGATAPAVKGLKPAEFAELENDGVICFTGPTADMGDGSESRLWRRLRDFLLAQFGRDEADSVVTEFDIEALAAPREPTDTEAQASAGFTDSDTEETETMTTNTDNQAAADFAERQAEIDKREADLAAREQAIADRETAAAKAAAKARRDRCAEFADGLVTDGKVKPADKPALIEALAAVEALEPVSFADGDATRTSSPGEVIRAHLSNLGKQLDFSERSAAGENTYVPSGGLTRSAEFGDQSVDADQNRLHQQALEYASAKGVTYDQAVLALTSH